MAMVDYGAILKINGTLINLNKGLFMDMKDAVGFTIEPIPYQYKYDGKTYNDEYIIDGNYFVYFGDEEFLFCIYKNLLRAVVNKKEVYDFYFNDEENKIIKHYNLKDASIKIKKIYSNNKLHAMIQYKGNKYEVIYGYGIDNNVKIFKKISSEKRYGYNSKITRYVNKFLN